MKFLPSPLYDVAKLLITNQQGGLLSQMSVTPDQPVEYKILGCIVVHAVSVFSSNMENVNENFLLPFINMLTDPKAISVSQIYVSIGLASEALIIIIWLYNMQQTSLILWVGELVLTFKGMHAI